ncbi:hypothetical protein [Clostridium aciditolerans]|uniref:Uncharacterized protein n=1 Tax=Clostridium aciditolerans TaxID=339861 RepID=A0A934M5S5_9CLOT|nr:hypothetical protein [Clostridium aciditolerans]MBI6875577.1 hypothetical protein [Clostridium aciditolerans]
MSNSLKACLNVTFGFVPLIFLWSISNKIGIVLGLISILILFIKNVINKNMGIISVVLLVYFVISNILYFYFKMDSVIQYRYLTSYIVLALMGFISTRLGKPYTMYEAKSGYREDFGESPLFIEVNSIITKIWATIYLVNAIIELLGHNTTTVIIMNILVIVGVALSTIIPGLLPEA